MGLIAPVCIADVALARVSRPQTWLLKYQEYGILAAVMNMQPTHQPQPALPYWIEPATPPLDPPDLFPFRSLCLSHACAGEYLPDPFPLHVYIRSGHYPAHRAGIEPELVYKFCLVGTGGPDQELTDSTVSMHLTRFIQDADLTIRRPAHDP